MLGEQRTYTLTTSKEVKTPQRLNYCSCMSSSCISERNFRCKKCDCYNTVLNERRNFGNQYLISTKTTNLTYTLESSPAKNNIYLSSMGTNDPFYGTLPRVNEDGAEYSDNFVLSKTLKNRPPPYSYFHELSIDNLKKLQRQKHHEKETKQRKDQGKSNKINESTGITKNTQRTSNSFDDTLKSTKNRQTKSFSEKRRKIVSGCNKDTFQRDFTNLDKVFNSSHHGSVDRDINNYRERETIKDKDTKMHYDYSDNNIGSNLVENRYQDNYNDYIPNLKSVLYDCQYLQNTEEYEHNLNQSQNKTPDNRNNKHYSNPESLDRNMVSQNQSPIINQYPINIDHQDQISIKDGFANQYEGSPEYYDQNQNSSIFKKSNPYIDIDEEEKRLKMKQDRDRKFQLEKEKLYARRKQNEELMKREIEEEIKRKTYQEEKRHQKEIEEKQRKKEEELQKTQMIEEVRNQRQTKKITEKYSRSTQKDGNLRQNGFQSKMSMNEVSSQVNYNQKQINEDMGSLRNRPDIIQKPNNNELNEKKDANEDIGNQYPINQDRSITFSKNDPLIESQKNIYEQYHRNDERPTDKDNLVNQNGTLVKIEGSHHPQIEEKSNESEEEISQNKQLKGKTKLNPSKSITNKNEDNRHKANKLKRSSSKDEITDEGYTNDKGFKKDSSTNKNSFRTKVRNLSQKLLNQNNISGVSSDDINPSPRSCNKSSTNMKSNIEKKILEWLDKLSKREEIDNNKQNPLAKQLSFNLKAQNLIDTLKRSTLNSTTEFKNQANNSGKLNQIKSYTKKESLLDQIPLLNNKSTKNLAKSLLKNQQELDRFYKEKDDWPQKIKDSNNLLLKIPNHYSINKLDKNSRCHISKRQCRNSLIIGFRGPRDIYSSFGQLNILRDRVIKDTNIMPPNPFESVIQARQFFFFED